MEPTVMRGGMLSEISRCMAARHLPYPKLTNAHQAVRAAIGSA
jgi:hypothetical protein